MCHQLRSNEREEHVAVDLTWIGKCHPTFSHPPVRLCKSKSTYLAGNSFDMLVGNFVELEQPELNVFWLFKNMIQCLLKIIFLEESRIRFVYASHPTQTTYSERCKIYIWKEYLYSGLDNSMQNLYCGLSDLHLWMLFYAYAAKISFRATSFAHFESTLMSGSKQPAMSALFFQSQQLVC